MRYPYMAFVVSFSLLAVACAEDVQSLGSLTGAAAGASTTTGPGSSSSSGSGAGSSSSSSGGQGGGGQGGGGPATAHARFGFVDGQEKVGDFCVAYTKDQNNGYVWQSQGLFAANQLSASAYEGLDRLTSYLPLSAAPVAFGFVYPGQSCAESAHGLWTGDAIPTGFDHFTVLAVPFSGEATQVWVVGDPVKENEGAQAGRGLRIVNASFYSYPIEVTAQGAGAPSTSLGSFDFANSPTEYVDVGADSLLALKVTEMGEPNTVEFDFSAMDLLALKPRRTIYYGGAGTLPRTALACADTSAPLPGDPKSASCHLVTAQAP